ncbi:TetR/AcrR family transcriptional regulator [Agromyces sp. G08B096]|uniref:TetR/AcrR family transcriptional regulator n=1 Tax=Agromyces sp. G08B096 TaxID=3156399 RepID=A0AAU7W6Q9_9MICO
MSTKDDWLDEGLRVLAAEGAPGVRTDRIAARLGLTKGSFHHHFRGAADYRRALLDRYAVRTLEALEDAVGEASALPPLEAFAALRDRAGAVLDQPLETAVRAWAFQDDDARATQARVDTARLEALTELWSRLVDDPESARTAALLPHLVIVGAAMTLPSVGREELSKVLDLLVGLVPHTAADL